MATVAPDGLTRWSASGPAVRRMCGRLLALGLVGVLLPAGSTVAQAPGQDARLTVRPREMATGTQNPKAGEYLLDSVPNYLVSVPQQCVGARRCPLFIFLPGAGYGAREVTDWLRPVADKYGMLLLAPTRDPAIPPKAIGPFKVDPGFTEELNTKNLDAALKQVLRRFAIDPDKIAIIGRCSTAGDGMMLGIPNLDVFSRVSAISGAAPTTGMDPRNKTVEFFIDAGYLESKGNFASARKLRAAGHPVTLAIGLRGHEHQVEDYDFLGYWLRQSWAPLPAAARPAAKVVAAPLPRLTIAAVAQMTTFWASFMQAPDSIRTTARRAHLREVVVPVGAERPSAWMVDIAALATTYPSVAAALKAAGLTAQQHDAYRVALLGALTTENLAAEAGAVDATSVLAQNLAFLGAHPTELAALAATGIWRTP